MAKNSIRDYSATNSSNTDIQSIDISEGCSPAGINNAIREVMADLKDVSTGAVALESPAADSLSVTGDLTVDTNTLYVDSTNNNVGIGTTPTSLLHIKGQAPVLTLQDTDTSGTTNIEFQDSAATVDAKISIGNSTQYMAFETAGTERLRIDSSGNVGIGTTSPSHPLTVKAIDTNGTAIKIVGDSTSSIGRLLFRNSADTAQTGQILCTSSGNMTFENASTEAMRISNLGRVGIGNAAPAGLFEVGNVSISGSDGQAGFSVTSIGQVYYSTSNANCMFMNDTSSSAGTHNYILFRYRGSAIGDIDTTNNSTIRYNTFTGGHWTQFSDYSQPTIKAGTVMSAINEMCKWTAFEYTDSEGETQKTDMAGTYEIGTTHTIYIDEDGAQAQGTAISHDTSERVVKSKISDTAGDRSVYGVFAGHYKDGDSSVESLGLGIIRIGSGVTVANGDLLESAGDGTARPQTGDTADLFKSSTIAKVTSTVVGETYDDGSYTVPCTLHCG